MTKPDAAARNGTTGRDLIIRVPEGFREEWNDFSRKERKSTGTAEAKIALRFWILVNRNRDRIRAAEVSLDELVGQAILTDS